MKKIMFLISFLFVFGCSEEHYTVDDFKKDNKLLQLFLEKCGNGEIHPQDINCINVKKAVSQNHKLFN